MKCSCERIDCPNHLTNVGNCNKCLEEKLKSHEIPNCFFNDAKLDNERLKDDYNTFAKLYLEKYGKENN